MKENESLPTRLQSVIFRGKASLLQLKRGTENLLDKNLRSFPFKDELKDKPVIAESETVLWTEKEPEEQFLLAGKIHNLRLAVRRLNGLEIAADSVFSFWKHVKKTTHWKGFVAGRELREGCIIPNIGGGLCQLSNALYDAALKANFEIIERHAHTQIVRGSLAEQGRDATVFWNYVDLRFKSPSAFRIEASLDAENLTVRFKSDKKKSLIQIHRVKSRESGVGNQNPQSAIPNPQSQILPINHHPNSCATCGVNDCFRVIKPPKEVNNFGRSAFLLDEFAPEFDAYIQQTRREKDVLFIPLDGRRFKKANYAWTTAGFSKVNQSLFVTFLRSYRSRQLAAQGRERQLNLLAMYERLAQSYAKQLTYDTLHVVVNQNLLPFLWKSGVLGGRTFDVLMTALPMKALQERLDFAHSLHPESKTLGDFRAESRLVEAETEALRNARKIITPHTEIAGIFPEQSELLNWHLSKSSRESRVKSQNPKSQIPNPKSQTPNPKSQIVFPASTVGRKGAYILREALRGLDIKLVTFGAQLEGENFWEGFDVERGNPDNGWLERADLVILPAFVEHKPKRLIEAASYGVPVIASKACGVENVDGIKSVEFDARVLRNEIENILKANERVSKNYERAPV